MNTRTSIILLSLLPALASRADARQALPGQIVDVVADSFFFRAPATIRPGLTTFRMHSPHGGHELRVIRLDSGRTVRDLLHALDADLPSPWARKMGGPSFPARTGTANASFVLEPGHYVLLCFVHGAGNTRHYQKGMFAQLTVRGRRVPGSLPRPDLLVSMVDYAYRFSAPVTPGRHVIRLTNDGTVVHEFKIFRVLPGFSPEQVMAWTRESGQPRPDEPLAAIAGIEPGVTVTTTIDFAPGDYLIACVPQAAHGMKQILHVAQQRTRAKPS